MSRSHKTIRKHKHKNDFRYQSESVSRFIRMLMLEGKKSTAQSIFYDAMDQIGLTGQNGLEIFEAALQNVRPALEVQSRRVGGTNYQIPIEVRPIRRDVLAMRWLILSARARNEHSMSERLAKELSEASQGNGSAVRKKEDIHKMAESNRAFAHLKW